MTLEFKKLRFYSSWGFFRVLDQNNNIVAESARWNSNSQYETGGYVTGTTQDVICIKLPDAQNLQKAIKLTTFSVVLCKSGQAGSNQGNGNYASLRSPGKITFTVEYTETPKKPSKPTFIWPAINNATTYNSKPRFKMKGTVNGTNKLKYYYKIDTGSWTAVNSTVTTPVSSGTEEAWSLSTALSAGDHTIYIKTNSGSDSDEVSRAFKYVALSNISSGSKITSNQMSNLATYINNLSSYYNTGTSTTITSPTQYTSAKSNNWTNYSTKISALPSGASFSNPTAGTKINASYYNSYLTTLQSK